jgi:hypothetical protein
MSELSQHLQRLVDDGAALARPPSPADLRRRLRLRRQRLGAATAGLVLLVAGTSAAVGYRWREHHSPLPAASAAASPAVMSADPTTVNAGGWTTVSAVFCGAGEKVFISVGSRDHNVEIGTAVADGRGGFTARVEIPIGTPAGSTWLWAGCKVTSPAGKVAHSVPIVVAR